MWSGVRASPGVTTNTHKLPHTNAHSDGQRSSGTQLFVQVIRAVCMKFARDADVTKLGLSLSGKNWVKDVREFGAEGDIGT